jgi:asparagine synthase (glutamine-hydrolysing)
MCGIAGKLFFDRARHVDPELLTRMHSVIAHRGPDDVGIHHDGAVGLAFRRLAIIDLTPTGHQPMASADGAFWIVFNGEIYNYQELRKELEGQGVRFRSQSDTEVILALYARHGVDCLQRLRGMFAFAIWNARERTLFIARDRLGKKPLHYYVDDEKVLFASEPKAIFADPDVPVAADPLAIHHYLTFGYVPSPFSAFRGVRKLPPAHYLLVRDGRVTCERYWRLRYAPVPVRDEPALCEEIIDRLREAVRLRMISDVPLGAFLSGGIDSSLVVALMAGLSSAPVKTFSIGFEEEAYNELPYARQVAERYGTDHHEFVVKPDAVDVLGDLVWHYNEPYADSSAIPTYYLSKMTRQHVTVALNGDAGDENFAGYPRYLGSRIAAAYQRVPRPLRRGLEWAVGALPEAGDPRGLYRRGKRFFGAVAEPPERRHARWIGFFTNALKAEIAGDWFRDVAAVDSIDLTVRTFGAVDVPPGDFLDAALAVDIETYLPDDLLVKVDIASMAHSLEARSPMLDHVFMEFAATIPAAWKLRGGVTKYILKRAAAPLLPASLIDRPKMGFGVPLDRWFRHELREVAYDTLLSTRARQRGLFRPHVVERMLSEHVGGRALWHANLWSLLFLEAWFQRFVDRR